jgi:hypothetical protein
VTAIFLSYRRADTGGYAGRLADSLEKHFGRSSVFQDVEAIVPGSNFMQAIDAAIARCEVLVVIIGDSWLAEAGANGRPRLEDPHDFVRLEVAAGLRSGVHVMPVLVEGTTMPAENALPRDLQPLARLQAIELSDTRWDYDVERLAKVICALTGNKTAPRRAYLVAGLSAFLATIAAVAGYITFNQPPAISGQWMLPNQSYWIVLQSGDQLTIEETHHDSKQVWKRGAGSVKQNRVTFFLATIYGAPHRYDGTLVLSPDARSMNGVISESNSPIETAFTLTRPP